MMRAAVRAFAQHHYRFGTATPNLRRMCQEVIVR
jgi:hypothetical protein